MTMKTINKCKVAIALVATMALVSIAGCGGVRANDTKGDLENQRLGASGDYAGAENPADSGQNPSLTDPAREEQGASSDLGNGSWDDLPSLEIPEGANVLTLATFHSRDLHDAVARFNAADNNCYIEVIDYAQYNTEDNLVAGLMRLAAEIVSGNVPDILDVSYLPYELYAGKGLFADLYPYIDADPGLSRSDFVDGVFNAAEIEGRLYQVFPSFYVTTIIGHPAVIGQGMGWNMDEFMSVIAGRSRAEMLLHRLFLNKTSLLLAELTFNLDKHIDWEAGAARFENAEFIEFLELCDAFPDEIDWNAANAWQNSGLGNYEEDIPAGRQVLQELHFGDFWIFRWNKALFGNEVVFKGYPADNRNGHSLTANGGLAIIESSPNKAAAWSFVRTLLDKDFQLGNHWSLEGFLTNKAAFDERAREAMAYTPKEGLTSIPVADFTQADVDQILAVIQNAGAMTAATENWGMDEAIWSIIREEAYDYFSGKNSATDAARIIQNRMSILVSERH